MPTDEGSHEGQGGADRPGSPSDEPYVFDVNKYDDLVEEPRAYDTAQHFGEGGAFAAPPPGQAPAWTTPPGDPVPGPAAPTHPTPDSSVPGAVWTEEGLPDLPAPTWSSAATSPPPPPPPPAPPSWATDPPPAADASSESSAPAPPSWATPTPGPDPVADVPAPPSWASDPSPAPPADAPPPPPPSGPSWADAGAAAGDDALATPRAPQRIPFDSFDDELDGPGPGLGAVGPTSGEPASPSAPPGSGSSFRTGGTVSTAAGAVAGFGPGGAERSATAPDEAFDPNDFPPPSFDLDERLAPSTFAPSSNEAAAAPPGPVGPGGPAGPQGPADPGAFQAGFDPNAGAPPKPPTGPEPSGPGRFVPWTSAEEADKPPPAPPDTSHGVRQNTILTIGVGVIAFLILAFVGYSVISGNNKDAPKASGSIPPLSSLTLNTPPPPSIAPPTAPGQTTATLPPLTWQPLAAPDGSWSIELPGTPTQTGDGGVVRNQVDLPQGQVIFIVNNDGGGQADVDARIDAGIEALRTATGGQVTINEPTDVGGKKAHHFVINTTPTAQVDTFEGYVVVSPTRLYLFGYGYRREHQDPAILEHLLATFNAS